MLKIDKNIVIYLNVLTLLKEEPKRFRELWESGYFDHEWELKNALHFLTKAGFIEKVGTKKHGYYVILGNGLKLLECYPNWEQKMSITKLVKEGVILPLRCSR